MPAVSSSGNTTSSTKNLPIFVFPQRIDFIANLPNAHKQVFTLHNPYDFPSKFKLLTTQRYRYRVMQREGIIKEKHCTDIIVRLHDNCIAELNNETIEKQRTEAKSYFARDKLRFEVSDLSTERPLGHRDVECYIWRTKSDYEYANGGYESKAIGFETNMGVAGESEDDSMITSFTESIRNNSRGISKEDHRRRVSPGVGVGAVDSRYRGSVWVPAIAIITCLVILSLPHDKVVDEDGNSSFLPSTWLKSSENQRLIAAYVLGILTMIIIQYQQ